MVAVSDDVESGTDVGSVHPQGQGLGKVANRPICLMTPRRGPAPRDRVGPGRESSSSGKHVRTFGTDRDFAGTLDLEAGPEGGVPDRVRAVGGGRKRAEASNPELLDALDALIEPETRGDPESALRWTTKSTRNLADELTGMGHEISHSVVAKILRGHGYSLQGTRKTLEGAQHPDRDAQFRYISSLATEFIAAGDPVISVDTKKKLRHEVARGE